MDAKEKRLLEHKSDLLRLKRGYGVSNQALAEMIGVSVREVYYWLKMKKPPSIDAVLAVKKLLNVVMVCRCGQCGGEVHNGLCRDCNPQSRLYDESGRGGV